MSLIDSLVRQLDSRSYSTTPFTSRATDCKEPSCSLQHMQTATAEQPDAVVRRRAEIFSQCRADRSRTGPALSRLSELAGDDPLPHALSLVASFQFKTSVIHRF